MTMTTQPKISPVPNQWQRLRRLPDDQLQMLADGLRGAAERIADPSHWCAWSIALDGDGEVCGPFEADAVRWDRLGTLWRSLPAIVGMPSDPTYREAHLWLDRAFRGAHWPERQTVDEYGGTGHADTLRWFRVVRSQVAREQARRAERLIGEQGGRE